MFDEDAAALAYGADDRGEVVVGEDHVRRLLGDVGARDAHRDADVGRLERGRVVDAVAGHRDDAPVRVERVDDPQLVLRRDAGIDGHLPHGGRARVVVHRRQLAARDDARARRGDAEIGGDPRRRVRMVAGDHQHAHARGVRVGDRGPGLRPRRVDDPDQPEVDELALDRLVFRQRLVRRQRPVGDRQRSQSEVGEAVDRREDLVPPRLGKRSHAPADALLGAAREQHVGRALGDDGDAELALVVGVHRAHQLPLGAERHLADALEPRAARSGQPFDLRLGHEERGLGGIALDRPLAAFLAQHGVVRQAAGCEHRAYLVEQHRVVERTAVRAQVALGPVAAAGDVDLARAGDDLLDRHLVLRQRPGLVRADHRRRPERLDRGQLLHDRPLLRHPLHAERQHHRQHGRQPLRHRGHRQRHPDEQHRDEIRRRPDVGGEQDRADHDGRDRDHRDPEHAADPVDLPLQRRHLRLRPPEQTRDGAHLRRHPGRGHDRPAAAAHDRGAAEHHVHAVAQPDRLRDRADVLQHRLALARQRGLGDRQGRRLDAAGRRRRPRRPRRA